MAEVGEVKEMEFEAAVPTDPNFEFTEEDEEELKKLESELEEPEDPMVEAEIEPEDEPDNPEAPEEPELQKTKSDNVPLSKYMQEKKRRQEVERALRERDLKDEKDKIFRDHISRGYPETEALRLTEEKLEAHKEREESRSFRMDLEIERLTKEPFFADAEAFSEDLKDLMKKNNKLTARQAYMMFRGEARVKEVQTEQELRNLNKRRKAESKKIVNASPSAPKTPYKLTKDDKKAIVGLRKAQPDVNWTPEKYFKMLNT